MKAALAAWLILVASWFICSAGEPPRNDGTHWRTLHGDLQRSGFYPRFPRGELELVWRKELHTELTGPRAEVIVGEGLAFMGTYDGRIYAWDAETGWERWVFETQGAVGHSPMLHGKTLYFGSMDRHLYAADAAIGKERWRFEAQEGIWTSPVCHGGLVMFGDRSGTFYALNAETGTPVWTFRTGGPILTTASVGPDGSRVVFGSEEMHVYCLSIEDGSLVWKSEKLHGLSLRDYFPVIVDGLVLVTTNPVKDFHTILDRNQRMFLSWAEPGFEGEDDRYIPADPASIQREQDRIVEYLKAHPSEQTFYTFRLEDGGEPWVAPLLYTGGLHNPMTPPCYNPDTGEVFVWVRSAYGVWDGGGEVRSYTGVGKLDLETGRVALIEHGHNSEEPGRPAGRKDMPWMSFNTIGDETQTLSCSPDFLFSNHQGYLGSMNFQSGVCENLFGKRDTYGGYYGPGNFGWESDGGREKAREAGLPFGIINEWHGPARAIVSVVGDRVYYPVGSQVLCLQAGKN